MALGDPYISVAELEAHLGKPDDGNFDTIVRAASRAVEMFTRRQFNRVDDAEPRRFRALDCERLPVDDFHSLDDLEVSLGGSVVDPSRYEQRPFDGVRDGVPGWPFEDLMHVHRGWPWNRRATVTVTARWGWLEVPPGIILAALDVASDFVTGDAGPVRSKSIDGYSVSYATSVMLARADVADFGPFANAAPYRKARFGVA